MAKMAMHLIRVVERADRTIFTTLCNRVSNRCVDGNNATDDVAAVTCKLCLAAAKRTGAAK